MGASLQRAVGLICSADPELLNILATTARVSLTSSVLALLLGVPLGILYGAGRFPGRRALLVLNRTLMGLPPVVCGLLFYLLFSGVGPFRRLHLLFTVRLMILAQVVLITPIVVGSMETWVAGVAPVKPLPHFFLTHVKKPSRSDRNRDAVPLYKQVRLRVSLRIHTAVFHLEPDAGDQPVCPDRITCLLKSAREKDRTYLPVSRGVKPVLAVALAVPAAVDHEILYAASLKTRRHLLDQILGRIAPRGTILVEDYRHIHVRFRDARLLRLHKPVADFL